MTSPTNVGQVSVDIVAEARGLAKSIRKEVEDAFKGLDVNKLIRESIGNQPIKIPIKPDFDEKSLPKNLPGKAPKVPVELDPLMAAFQAEIKRQTTALAREINIKVPVDGDASGLREQLGSQLKAVSDQLKVKVPAEPGDKAKFQSELQAQLAEVSARVKAHVGVEADTKELPEKIRETRVPAVKVDVDPVLSAFQAQVREQANALARTVNTKVPVGADTSRLRAELGAQIAAVQAQLKVEVPTEPTAKSEYASKLKDLVEQAAAEVTAHVKVDSGTGAAASSLAGIPGLIAKVTPSFGGLSTLVSGVGSAIQGLAGEVQRFAEQAAEGGSQLAGSIASAAGPVGAIVASLAAAATAMGGLGAAAVFVVPAITAVAGAAAAIPAALAGAGAVFGTLGLGFKGIADAFKPKTGGGGGGAGSAVNQAKQVAAASRSVEAARRGVAAANRGLEASERGLAAAERGVVQAQQALVDAEKDVTAAQKRSALAQVAVSKARVEAAEDIDDLNRALRGAKLSEEDAALSVTEALRALNTVKLTGNIPDIQRADLAYREALQTLDEAKDTTSDLQKTTDDANTKGVEGSDKVVSALQDQSDALDAVTKAQEGVVSAQNGIIDATDSLKSAQDGVLSAQDGIKSAANGLASAQDSLAQAQTKQATAGAAAAAAVTKLAPAATRFVNALKALQPAFENLRLDVQQRLFEGLDKTVTNLGNAWIPALKVTLGSYADTFNGFFKSLGTAITTPTFIKDIQAGAEGARQGLASIGDSVTTSLVPAFGALSRAAGPFLAALGKEIAGIVTQFSNWVLQGEKTGALKSFFDKAVVALHEIFTTGKLVGSIIGDLFSIITGAQSTKGKTPLDSFNNALKSLDTWLQNPKNQKSVSDFISSLADSAVKIGKFIKDLNDFGNKVNDFVDKLGRLGDKINGFFDKLFGGVGDSKGKGSKAGQDLGDGLFDGFGTSLAGHQIAGLLWEGPNSLIGRIKSGLGIASPSTVMMEIGRNLIDGLTQGLGEKFGALGDSAGQLKTIITNKLSDAGSWLYGHGRQAVSSLEAGITSLSGSLSTRAGTMKTAVQNKLSDAGSWLTTHGRSAVGGLQNGINAQLGALRTTAGNAKTTVQNALSTAGTWLTTHGRNVIIGLGNGIISMYGSLRTWAGNARVYITNALSNAGSLLVTAGRNVIIGLINGIGAMLGTLGNYLGDVGAFIVAHKGPPSKDKVMLYGAGQLIMGGLITGIGDKKDALAAELADVTNLVAGTTLPGLGAGMDAAVSASLQASSQQQVQVAWKPGSTGDQLLDSMAHLIDLRYRGDVQAALSRS